MSCLGTTCNSALKLKTLDWSIKSGDVKLQDYFYAIGGVANTVVGANIAWKYYKEVIYVYI